MTQAPVTEIASSADEGGMNPFGDFDHQLKGHLSGAPIPNGRAVLLELLTFIADIDEETSFGLVAEAAQFYGVDIGAASNSRAAFDLLVPG